MSICFYRKKIVNGNSFWQERVQPKNQIVCCNTAVIIEVHKKLFGMYSCIGATCSHSLNFSAQQSAKGFLKFFLHRNSIRLVLPSVVVFSVVGYFKKVAHVFIFFVREAKITDICQKLLANNL